MSGAAVKSNPHAERALIEIHLEERPDQFVPVAELAQFAGIDEETCRAHLQLMFDQRIVTPMQESDGQTTRIVSACLAPTA